VKAFLLLSRYLRERKIERRREKFEEETAAKIEEMRGKRKKRT